ncbi:MAG: hypothetical protein OXH03_12590 [Bacteroidetes bacterium]|nr:hypothetical protein [Bacteroidota bacterium]MXW82007.1 hypothetical protein [Rhodothermaceae bacterium]MDE2672710.1 hypothetical protein [Bacteroidota bacterium]MXX58139.1 hypothetical protein [Rhodothermaceae bacterium]MYD20290.1 hypothetical protein [Rhodothermaceae bacterium]
MLVEFLLFRADSIGTSNVEVAEGFVNMLLLVAVGIFGYWFRNGPRKNDAGEDNSGGKIETPFVARMTRDDMAMGYSVYVERKPLDVVLQGYLSA